MRVTGARQHPTTLRKKTPGRAIVGKPGQRTRLEESVAYWKEETDKAWEAAHRGRTEAAAELCTQIKALGALIPVNTGGSMENDPPDAILAAAIRIFANAK